MPAYKYEAIGSRLKLLRGHFTLTQSGFADMCGVNRGYLAELEVGRKKPSSNILTLLIAATDVNSNWLLTGEGAMFQNSDEEEPTSGIVGEDFSDAFKMVRMFDEKLSGDEIVTILEIMAGLPANRRQEVLEFAKVAKAKKESNEMEAIRKDLREMRIELDKMKKEKRS